MTVVSPLTDLFATQAQVFQSRTKAAERGPHSSGSRFNLLLPRQPVLVLGLRRYIKEPD